VALARAMLLVLVAVAGLLLVELLLSDDGYRKTLKLRQAVAEQQELNTELRRRNAALDAEVINLKRGRAAAEERARTDLGLIAPGETFYQVISTKEP
jgi:cell division protein FtsB